MYTFLYTYIELSKASLILLDLSADANEPLFLSLSSRSLVTCRRTQYPWRRERRTPGLLYSHREFHENILTKITLSLPLGAMGVSLFQALVRWGEKWGKRERIKEGETPSFIYCSLHSR